METEKGVLDRGEQGQEAQKLPSSPGHQEARQGRSGQYREARTFSLRPHPPVPVTWKYSSLGQRTVVVNAPAAVINGP